MRGRPYDLGSELSTGSGAEPPGNRAYLGPMEGGEASQESSLNVYERECLESPAVQSRIRQEAEVRAETLAGARMERFHEEQNEKKSEKIRNYFDESESFFANAVNVFSEEYELEEQVAERLHRIVETGFEKQRDIYARLEAGELTEAESKELGAASHQADKEAVLELLGEDLAGDFSRLLREEAGK